MIKDNFANYYDINQRYRANSILENFHREINEYSRERMDWPNFLLIIKTLENKYVKELIDREKLGIHQVPSDNFGKKYTPKTFTSTDNTKDLTSSLMPKIKAIQLPSNEKPLISTRTATAKRKASQKDKPPAFPIKLKKVKLSTAASSNINYELDWLIWSGNSCRYDAFLTMYIFTFFNNNSALIPLKSIPQGMLNLWLCCENLMDNILLTEIIFGKFHYSKSSMMKNLGTLGM